MKLSFFEKMIGIFSPRAALERAYYRNEYDAIRKYDGASSSRLNSNSNWGAFIESAEAEDQIARDTLRARARDLEHNSDVFNSLISAYIRNVIGRGFKFQAKTDNDDMNTKIEALWHEWCKARNCDVTGQQSFIQILRMAIRRKKIDGGILFLKTYTKDGILPFKLQALDVDELSSETAIPKKKGNKVAGGIEFDQYNKPVGYWIKKYTIDGWSVETPQYIDAKDVIFIYSKRRPSQIREVTDMAPTLTRVRDVNEFINAVAVKERVAACLSVFVRKSAPAGGFGRGATPAGNKIDYTRKKLTPGMIAELNAGDDIQTVNPGNGAQDATQFLKLQQRLIGAGQGLSYEATARDMSEATYSSARQANIEDELTYLEDQELILKFMDEVYETFLISAVLSGALDIPDFWQDKNKYFKHTFIQPPKKWIDPQKEANATATSLQNNIKTFAQVCAEGGRDWRDVIDELATVQAYAREKGVQLANNTATTETTTEATTQTEEEDEKQ